MVTFVRIRTTLREGFLEKKKTAGKELELQKLQLGLLSFTIIVAKIFVFCVLRIRLPKGKKTGLFINFDTEKTT